LVNNTVTYNQYYSLKNLTQQYTLHSTRNTGCSRQTNLGPSQHRLNTPKHLNWTLSTSSFELWNYSMSFGLT